MMIKTEEASLNALRVASSEWLGGLVYYQGVTSRTTLSTDEKATQTLPAPKSKTPDKTFGHSGPKVSSNKKDTNRNKPGDSGVTKAILKEKEIDTSIVNDDLQEDNPRRHKGKKQRYSCQRTPLSSPSFTTTTFTRRSAFPEKTLLPLPNVSWNELAKVDEVPRSTSCLPTHNPWLSNQKISRPQTAGPRVIVPLKHSCPVGLNKEDVIRGTRLCNLDTSQCDISSDKAILCASSNGVLPSSKQNSDKRTWKKDEVKKIPYRPLRNDEGSSKIEALELTITSIQPESWSLPPASDENNSDDGGPSKENDLPKNNKNDTNSSSFINSYNFNTMEGIRKSYRRARSAPPTHRHQDRVQCANNMSPDDQTNQKQFSNLYWRAKSAYHKKLEATSEDDAEDIGREDQRTSCQTSRKHTLLRPLLRVDGDIKHSAGCPYKCKGCFKACLVSDDYVQKAIAKALQGNDNPVETTREGKPRAATKTDIVREALGRSQPLFQHVYGGGKVRGRIKIRPWPKYGWMDMKIRKEDNLKLEERKESEMVECNSTASGGDSEQER